MKLLAAFLSLATLVSCAGPVPEPVDEAAVVEPGAICRIGHNGGPAIAERGIGGTGAPANTQLSDRGIGGTGIVGVVTGFASICVDGLEVGFDKTVAVSIGGSAATTKQLRVGQLVIIKANGPVIAADSVAHAQMISVRYEVSGPIEAIDIISGAMRVAGQPVMTLSSTWMAGHFGVGDWVSVSGLRRSDGTIIASRLDRALVGPLAVRGRITREQGTTYIGRLALRGSVTATVKTGTFVSIAGGYGNGAADVTAIDTDPLSEDPTGYFGLSTRQLVVQAFVRVERGTVWLNTGQSFAAGPAVQGNGSFYRNGIVWLERTANGSFIATELHYTNYRAQPKEAPPKSGERGAGRLILPPDPPPGPPTGAPPADATGGESGINGIVGPALTPSSDAPIWKAAPFQAEPFADRAFIVAQPASLSP